jgi:hypothetical protein
MTFVLDDNDGFGFVGEVRRFELNHIEWQAFEFRRPIKPYVRTLTVTCGAATRVLRVYPRNWRSMPAEDLVAQYGPVMRVNTAPPTPIRGVGVVGR